MEKIFFFLYGLLVWILYLVSMPSLWLFSFKSKYRTSIPARFFLRKNPPLRSNGIWFHSCSFGEANAIKPLVRHLPQESLRMTTTTQTGYGVIQSYTNESRYLPFEALLFGWIKPQKALVVMEAEFWYLLFTLAKKRGAKTLLINARMSERSFSRYYRFRWFYKQIFRFIDEVYAQTQLDKERLALLGAHNISVTGNIKLAYLPEVSKVLGKPLGLLVCAASTHRGEEGLILEAFLKLKEERSDAKLVVAPRHPERFEEAGEALKRFCENHRLTMQRYSEDEIFHSDMILLDRLGELVNVYAISDVVILGGSFEPIGGHNAAEAAQFGCRIISGKHYFNQKELFSAIEGIAVVEASNLARRLTQYALLKPTHIKYQSDIMPIVKSLKDVL